MATTITLNCPKCTKDLEIDGGFAGGVCRCADCDCLIAVPRRSSQKAEMIRPAKPGEVARLRAEAKKQNEDWPVDDEFGPEEDLLADDRSDVHNETYVTESGRSVRVDTRKVPTAKLARARRLTSAAVILITLGAVAILATIGYVAVKAIQEPATDDQTITVDTVVQIFPYAPNRNPMTLDKPNAMGMSLRDPCLVLINVNADQVDLHRELAVQLSHGLTRTGSNARVLLAYRGDGKNLFMTEAPVPLDRITADQVTEFLTPLRPGDGRADSLLKDAFETLGDKDSAEASVVWLQAGDPDPSDLSAIRTWLEDHPDRRVDALLINAGGFLGTEDALAANPGEVQTLSGIKLDRWRPFTVGGASDTGSEPDSDVENDAAP